MKSRLLLFFLLTAFLGHTQPPWRAKFFVHFLDSNNQIVTDTVWFGCDSLGAEGYQSGLDVIDTNLQWNKVYSTDDLIKVQFNTDCANLKTNIRNFKKKESFFKFYAIGKPVSMSWDTLDFMYSDSIYRLSLIEIKPVNGYVYSMDGKGKGIGGDVYKKVGNDYYYQGFWYSPIDSIEIFPESRMTECEFTSNGFIFYIEVYMGWQDFTGLDHVFVKEHINIYPNPFSEKINIKNNLLEDFDEIILYNIQGEVVIRQLLTSTDTEINTSQFPSGLYYLSFKNQSQHKLYKPIKLIKL